MASLPAFYSAPLETRMMQFSGVSHKSNRLAEGGVGLAVAGGATGAVIERGIMHTTATNGDTCMLFFLRESGVYYLIHEIPIPYFPVNVGAGSLMRTTILSKETCSLFPLTLKPNQDFCFSTTGTTGINTRTMWSGGYL